VLLGMRSIRSLLISDEYFLSPCQDYQRRQACVG
jgi:hypothetical protein